MQGYYLIGYRPAETTFPRSGRLPYHRLTLKLKRADLSVRSRKGFYGVADQPARPAATTREAQMAAALESPFAAAEVRLRLTPVFANTTQGSSVRTFLHIDGRDLTFVEQQDGWHQATLDVMVSSYGDKGLIADYLARTETIRARGKTYETILRRGLNYNLLLPMTNPGAYQIRAAVRDVASNRAGSAYKFVDVPDLKKKQLALSGLIVNTTVLDLSALSAATSVFNPQSDQDESQPTPGVRRFRAGMQLNYAFVIYNAVPEKRTGLPRVNVQLRLFRNGDLVSQQEDALIEMGDVLVDSKRVKAAGRLDLNDDLQPGQYILQIVVTDTSAKPKPAVTSQWIDMIWK